MLRTITVIVLISMVSCQSTHKEGQDSTTTDSAATNSEISATENGWQPIFDGTSTAGWHTYGSSTPGAAWEVKDGALYLNTATKEGRGDLVTDNEYGNYELQLEWKISEGGNSGIIFNVKEDTAKYPRTYNTGPEMQVLDNEKHADAKIHKHRAGDLYDLIASSEETVKPVGEWNEVRIISNNGKLDFYLNGTNVVSTTMFDDSWKALVTGSKFASMPGFGTFTSGKIALQDHGDEVWYRGIKIKEL